MLIRLQACTSLQQLTHTNDCESTALQKNPCHRWAVPSFQFQDLLSACVAYNDAKQYFVGIITGATSSDYNTGGENEATCSDGMEIIDRNDLQQIQDAVGQ